MDPSSHTVAVLILLKSLDDDSGCDLRRAVEVGAG